MNITLANNSLITKSPINKNLTFNGNRKSYEYLCIDEYNNAKNIDIDGDNIGDLSHGEVIERIIKGLCPQANITRINIKKNELEDSISTSAIDDCLNEALTKIKEKNFDGINLSFSCKIEFNDFEADGNKCTGDNFKSLRAIMRKELEDHVNKEKEKHKDGSYSYGLQTFISVLNSIKAIEKVVKEKIPVYMSDLIDDKKFFNIFSLAKGIKTVCGTDAKGDICLPGNIKTQYKAQGIYGITPVKENHRIVGYDITGDGIADVDVSEVSGKGRVMPNIEHYINQPLEDLLISKEEFEYAKKRQSCFSISGKLATIDQYAVLKKLNSTQIQTLKAQGKYVDLYHGRVYDVDKKGYVIYNPDRSGRKNIVNALIGASFASPAKLVLDTFNPEQ
ncbi:MAG: hypothetical protein AB7V50_09610 [Vampirovibrionia bacterium]